MSEHALAAKLAQRERELALIYELDRVRDTAMTPEAFLNGVAAAIQTTLQPDLLQVMTLDENDWPGLHITHERWRPADGVPLMTLVSQSLSSGASGDLALEDGEVLVRALRVRNERLGTLVIGRRAGPWSPDDRALVAAICSQIDSAIAQVRTLHQLHCRKKELEAIYRLDRLIDSTPDFETTLAGALALLSETIGATWSFIMLYTPDERELELRAASHQDISRSPIGDTLRTLARETVEGGKLVRRQQVDAHVGSYIGVPLILQNQIIGVFGGANPPGAHGFGADEVKMLQAIASQMDTALFEDRRQRHVRETFARYVSPAVVDLMLRTPGQDFLKIQRMTLTMLFSDMRGFTSVSEQLPADVVAQMLNEHLAAMTMIIRDAGGTVDKFVGDEVVAFFGAPLPRPDHALLAVRTARQMQRGHQALMADWQSRGLPAVPIGIGIGTGEVIVGNIGSAQMMNYTAIGPDVNLAARLCGAAAPNQILINEETYQAVAAEVRAVPVEPLSLRHIANLVQAYSVE
ncbi:MAG TPA: adenylate/guanylate cyclase domain-containing protein [Herpetosiphonaceae bacterium]